MKPEPGKWYWIEYLKATSKRGFQGPALCMEFEEHESQSRLKVWSFCQPDVSARLRKNKFTRDLYSSRDIKHEVKEPNVTADSAMHACYASGILDD